MIMVNIISYQTNCHRTNVCSVFYTLFKSYINGDLEI